MLNKIYKTLPFLTLFVLPIFANAQVLSKTTTLFTQAKFIVTTILIPLVFALALLLFFWGVAKYIWSEGQGKEVKSEAVIGSVQVDLGRLSLIVVFHVSSSRIGLNTG